MNHILNLIHSILTYSDGFVTDNPKQRQFDHTRSLLSIPVNSPTSDVKIIPPGSSFMLFNGSVPHSMNNTSIINLTLASPSSSIYRLKVTSGPSNFRQLRNVTGISSCTVTINNNAVAVFDFSGADLSSVQVGDIMRVKGISTYDSAPFAFNPINSGIWVVLGISGTKVSCVRLAGQMFSGINETVASATNDVIFYSSSGVQVGNKIMISGTLSVVSQRTYEIIDVTPDTIYFTSTIPLPEETNVSYVLNTIVIYSEAKRFIYIEADQEAIVRFNDDTTNNVKITPIKVGDQNFVGFISKWGDAYNCSVVNNTINPLTIRYFLVE